MGTSSIAAKSASFSCRHATPGDTDGEYMGVNLLGLREGKRAKKVVVVVVL